jgi:hypothetical protein
MLPAGPTTETRENPIFQVHSAIGTILILLLKIKVVQKMNLGYLK